MCPRLPGKPGNPWRKGAEEPWREGRRGGWRDSALSLSPTQSTGEGPSLVKAALELFFKIQLLDSSGITTAVCGQTNTHSCP